jgi:hypothetical protein
VTSLTNTEQAGEWITQVWVSIDFSCGSRSTWARSAHCEDIVGMSQHASLQHQGTSLMSQQCVTQPIGVFCTTSSSLLPSCRLPHCWMFTCKPCPFLKQLSCCWGPACWVPPVQTLRLYSMCPQIGDHHSVVVVWPFTLTCLGVSYSLWGSMEDFRRLVFKAWQT